MHRIGGNRVDWPQFNEAIRQSLQGPPMAPRGPYKGRFFHVSPSDSGNEPSFAGIESAGQGSGQPWPMGSGW